MQVYNLGVDPKTHKPSGQVEWNIMKDGKSILTKSEPTGQIPNASQQVTLEKVMPLNSLQPGRYTVQIKVTDDLKNQSVSPIEAFEVR